MKTLFLKSNLLHIRTNEREYEVNNPEIVGKFGLRILSESFILRYPLFTKDGYILLEGNDEAEWLGGVELIDMCGVSDNKYDADGCSACHGLCPEVNKLARLLPKEEKKAESAYKEGEKEQFEKLASDIYDKWAINHDGRIYMTRDLFTLALYHYKKSEPVSAPSESQEEIWKKHIQQEELWDDAISIGESEKSRKSAIHKIMKYFTITRNP